MRCLRGLDANLKLASKDAASKFYRLLADCKSHGVNLGLARLCSGSKQ
ncbi:hypothetical protein [uncultured Campylobacter sp.]|nr:hypothetical protein [uncultured Campylobacter sp.]